MNANKRHGFGLIFLFLFCSLFGAEPDFYVWQRLNSPELKQAVTEFYRNTPGKLCFLAGELENDGMITRIAPSKEVDFSRSVPVVRIHIKNLKKKPVILADEICGIYAPWKSAKALEIDLDAPESRLDYYRDLMLELRKKLKDVKLSATVLPCHLKHEKAFLALADSCDHYVLQVHGLTHRNGKLSIYDHAEALKAVMLAKSLKHPFKTALPLYCNRVSGKWIKPDMTKVSELAAVCGEVIGFRLGIPGDGSSLDLNTALRVCRGAGYAPKLESRWEKKSGGAWHLFIRNCGFFAEKVTLRLNFKEAPDDMDTFNHARLDGKNRLTLILPPSGTEKPYLWVRTGRNEMPSSAIEIEGENIR